MTKSIAPRHQWDSVEGERMFGTALERCSRCGVERKQFENSSLRVGPTSGVFTKTFVWSYRMPGNAWREKRPECRLPLARTSPAASRDASKKSA